MQEDEIDEGEIDYEGEYIEKFTRRVSYVFLILM